MSGRLRFCARHFWFFLSTFARVREVIHAHRLPIIKDDKHWTRLCYIWKKKKKKKNDLLFRIWCTCRGKRVGENEPFLSFEKKEENKNALLIFFFFGFFPGKTNNRCPNFRWRIKRVPNCRRRRRTAAPWSTDWLLAAAVHIRPADEARRPPDHISSSSSSSKATWRPWLRISSTRKRGPAATARRPCSTGSTITRAAVSPCRDRAEAEALARWLWHRWPDRPALPSSLATTTTSRPSNKSSRPHRRPPAVHVSSAPLRLVTQSYFSSDPDFSSDFSMGPSIFRPQLFPRNNCHPARDGWGWVALGYGWQFSGC